MKLYEIDEAYQAWQEKVMEAEGEVYAGTDGGIESDTGKWR